MATLIAQAKHLLQVMHGAMYDTQTSNLYTDIAQLGAQVPYKDKVGSSSLSVGTEVLGNGSPLDLGSRMCRFKSGHLNCRLEEWLPR